MIRGILLTIFVLAVLSYFGFDLNVVVHKVVAYAIDAWNALRQSFAA